MGCALFPDPLGSFRAYRKNVMGVSYPVNRGLGSQLMGLDLVTCISYPIPIRRNNRYVPSLMDFPTLMGSDTRSMGFYGGCY